MSFDNINLWFANDKDNKTIFAKDITPEIKHDKYTCPICGGLVRPKTGEKMSWHYAHINAEDCNSETIVHWFVKHELLKVGDKFKVNINEEIKEYECKEIIKEKDYNTQYGVYRPDLTIITTTNEIIYIEIANTNKKKIKDFIDMWKELGNTVIEFKVGEVLDGNKIDIFNSIWYVGKEYNEQLKELRQVCNKEKEKYEFTKDQVEQIDWLIDDICKYNNGLIEIDELSDEIQSIENKNKRRLVCNIVRNKKCGNVLNDYVVYNKNKILNFSSVREVKIPRVVYDRLYGDYNIFSSIIKIDKINILKIKEIDKYEIIEKINSIDDIYVTKLCNNNIKIKYKNKKCFIEYNDRNIDNIVNKINDFKKEVNKEIMKNNILKNNILLNTYNNVNFDEFYITYDENNNIICVIKEISKWERKIPFCNLKDFIENINYEKIKDRNNLILNNKRVLKDLNLKNKNVKIYYKNKHINCFYNSRKIIDNEYVGDFNNSFYVDVINNVANNIEQELYFENIKIKLNDKILFLNKRFFENVHRKPCIELGVISNQIVMKVYIKYKNRRGALSDHLIDYFIITGEENLNELEQKSCDIIRNYIYGIKENNK